MLKNGDKEYITMVKYIYPLVLMPLVISCATQKNEDRGDVDSPSETSRVVPQQEQVASAVEIISDSIGYFTRVGKFGDNNTFYVDLRFVGKPTEEELNQIREDNAVIYQDEETTRSEVRHENYRFFKVAGINEIDIYSKDNIKLTRGKFLRVEYVEDLIEGRYVAVYAADDPTIKEYSFCGVNTKDELVPLRYSEFQDDSLKQLVLDAINLPAQDVFKVIHYELQEPYGTYAVVSSVQNAYIVVTINGESELVYKGERENILSLVIVSKKVNGRPILLAECGIPDSDMMWSTTLVFNGQSYKSEEN